MLVLSRKKGESIILNLPDNSQVKITLTEYKGQKTLIGIDAPLSVEVLREGLIEEDSSEKNNFKLSPICPLSGFLTIKKQIFYSYILPISH